MRLKVNREDVYLHLTFTIFTCFVSYVISNRELSQVEDNIIYYQNFLYKLSFNDFYYEFLFDLITFIIRFFTDNYIIYFFFLNFILNLILFFLSKKVSELANINKFFFIFLFFSFCLYSSWYQVAAANGLRQGLSLAFLYLFLLYFLFNLGRMCSLLFLICSVLLHYSSLLILPFVLLGRLSLNKLFLMTNIFGFLYMLGVNEKIVYFVSMVSGIPLYGAIKNYIEDSDSYRYGFQWDLFLYSLVFSYFYYFFSKYFFDKNEILSVLVKIYYVCLLPYFFFGFAAFSNRYGLFSWFFSILLNSLIFYLLLSMKKSFFLIGFFCIWFTSIFYFIVVFKVI